MGSPKHQRKKYKTPIHPWSGSRILGEKDIIKNYGLQNKKEIWRAESKLLLIKKQVKRIIASSSEQSEREKMQLLSKLFRYNLIQKETKLDEILGLQINDVLERRLQTIVFKKNLAKSQIQARQFITHGHILIDNKRVTMPSYFVTRDEENKITLSSHLKIFEQEMEKKTKA